MPDNVAVTFKSEQRQSDVVLMSNVYRFQFTIEYLRCQRFNQKHPMQFDVLINYPDRNFW